MIVKKNKLFYVCVLTILMKVGDVIPRVSFSSDFEINYRSDAAGAAVGLITILGLFAGVYGIIHLTYIKMFNVAKKVFCNLSKGEKNELAEQVYIYDFLSNKKRRVDVEVVNLHGCNKNSEVIYHDRKSENELAFYWYTEGGARLEMVLDSIDSFFSTKPTKISALKKVIKDNLSSNEIRLAKAAAAKFISDNNMIY
jgi:hypothetical protein